jgi:pimeloyl-ACP methyl ester carboxylesterase
VERSQATVGAVVLVPLLVFIGFPLARFTRSNQENLVMNDAARGGAPGSFIHLSEGVTHYEIGGPAAGVPLLLIPGFSTPYNVWDPTFDGLARAGIRVLRYELYGRGWSDRPDARYDPDFYDRQVVDLLDGLHMQQVDIAGVSMGGPIAATFANRHPDRVRRVVLIDPAYLTGFRLPFGIRTPVLGEYNMAVAVAPSLPESQWEDFIHPERYPHYLDPYYEQMRYQGFRRAILATLRNYISRNLVDEYEKLGKSGKPVLLFWGKSDQDVPFEYSEKVRAAIPQAEFHPIEDAAHIPHFEHPELVNPIVLEFLQRPSAHD